MTATRKEIIDWAGDLLSVVSVGFNMEPEDFQIIATVYDGLHARMLIKNEIYWSDSDCVPDESGGLMAPILAGTVLIERTDFGLAPDEKQEIVSMKLAAEGELREIKQDQPSGQNVEACYF